MVERAESEVESRGAFDKPGTVSRYCLLSVGKASIAIALSCVREVFKLESITPVPGMPSAFVGVANLRGSVIPLADVRMLLGADHSTHPQYAVVVRKDQLQIGIVIDDIPEIRIMQPDDVIDTFTSETSGNCSFLSGSLKMGMRTSGLVDLSKLLTAFEGIGDQQAA